MTHKLYRPFLIVLGLVLLSFAPSTQPAEEEKVILVDLQVESPKDAGRCYSSQFDQKRIELPLKVDDPLYTLDDYSLGEESLEGPGCFMPEMKFIFRTSTYVFSLYCTKVVKYKNSAPYTPSSRTVKSDIRITPSVLDVLEEIQEKHFQRKFNPEVAQRFVTKKKLDQLDTKVDDSSLYKDEDAEEDKEIAKDAIDKEGWFDEKKDPGLEEAETSEEDE